jgi:polyisoprenoid-binding protein YceI
MKTLIAAVLAVSTIGAYAQSYKVDSQGSKITYVGKKVTGEHTGNVTIKEGTLTFKGEELNGGVLVADMNSLSSTDITDQEYNAKYVSHMKSPDFFNTEKFPTSTLKIKSSKKTDKGVEVTGDLTLIGQTKPITFIVTDLKKTDAGVTGKTSMTLNRTQWGLKYGSTSFFKGLGDKAINDEFTLAVDIAANVAK